MAKELNLTPDQEARLKEAKETHRAQIEKLRLALKEKRKALRDELSKPGVTRQSVEPLVAEIKAMEAGLTDQRIQGIFAVKEILTPEQFARLQAGKEARHKKGRKNHCRKGW
jgi:Spy/CpxP family protein refolding chaperone